MSVVGHALTFSVLLLAVYGVGACGIGIATKQQRWVQFARRSTYLLAGMVAVAFVLLEVAFVTSNFTLSVVAEHSSTTTPTFYRLAALWSSQSGSLVLWLLLLLVWSSLALYISNKRLPIVTPWANLFLLGFASFFAMLLVFFADPFEVLAPAAVEGSGLSPTLRHPSMMFHPPMLYSGYTLFTVPFVFALAALITRQLDLRWVRATRRFALAAWLCLGIGVLLGARWSYVELGWGGYWGWDPVENAALLPWLVGTAYLHSIMIQEKRGMLKAWNVTLILTTGVLAVLGTFLVRSGILKSIHAFGASTLGTPFLMLIAGLIILSMSLVIKRRQDLQSEHRIESVLSREAVFLYNNILLLVLAVVILWGTFFPIISRLLSGQESAVGPLWFNRYTVPLALALIVFSGLGPLLPWRRVSVRGLVPSFAVPVLLSVITVGVLLAVGARGHSAALVMFGGAAFVITVVGQEFWRGMNARAAMTGTGRPRALVELVQRNRRRYGGYLVHVGVAVLLVGVAASSAFHHVQQVTLRPGQSTMVGDYKFTYTKPTTNLSNEKVSLGATVTVERGRKRIVQLHPERNFYPSVNSAAGIFSRYFIGEQASEVGLQAGVWRDLWVAMEPRLSALESPLKEADRRFPDATGRLQAFILSALLQRYQVKATPVDFRVQVSPLVSWIWIGGMIMFCGGLIALWPARSVRQRGLAGAVVALDNAASDDDLTERKEAKYRELYELELDYRTGKVSPEDFKVLDQRLRAEALTLLEQEDERTRERVG